MGKNHRNKPKRSEAQSTSRSSKALESRPVSAIRLILEILGIVMTVQFFYPKISVSPSVAWDSTNPLQSTFTIKNDSNVICYAIKCSFGSTITVRNDATLNAPEEYQIPSLCPNETTTIPTRKILTTSPNAISDAEIYINLKYHPSFSSLPFFKKSYRFKARKTPSGYIWEPLYMDRRIQ